MSDARPFEYLSLVEAQQDITARCLADPYFSDITVLNDRIADIVTEVSKAIGLLGAQTGKKIGACIIVMQPVANYANVNAVAGPMDTLFSFLVLEDPVLNDPASGGSGKQALHLCRRLVDVFATYQPVGLTTLLMPQKPCIVPTPGPTAPVAYEVRFGAREAGGRAISKAALPTITITPGPDNFGVAIGCATSDVDIWYTTDGTHPWSGNPTAILWNGTSFAPTFTCLVRACAFKRTLVGTDWIASDVNAQQCFRELGDEPGNALGTETPQTITI